MDQPSGTGGEPPVIKAEQGPTKIVPAAPSDNQLNKPIHDRVGDRGGERVVPREEQPVDVRTARRRSIRARTRGVSQRPAPSCRRCGAHTAPPLSAGPSRRRSRPSRSGRISRAAARPLPARTPTATPPAPAAAAPAASGVTTVPVQTTPARPAACRGRQLRGAGLLAAAARRTRRPRSGPCSRNTPSVLGGQPMAIRRAELGRQGPGHALPRPAVHG